MGTRLYKSDNVTVGTSNVTITHNLGVAPVGEDGVVIITDKTGPGTVFLVSADAGSVVLRSTAAGSVVDVTIIVFHNIIK